MLANGPDIGQDETVDFDDEHWLDDLHGSEREQRRKLLRLLADDGFSEQELRVAVAENRLALLPVDRMLGGTHSAREIEARTGLPADVLVRMRRLVGLAEPGIDDRYEFEIEEGEPAILDIRPAIVSIVRDISSGRRVGEISARFHNTLSVAIGEVCGRIGSSDAVDRVCLSGGSFQNLYLLGRTVVELRRRSFDVFLHAQVPANDGGLSLGQAMVANEHLRQGE